MYSRTLKTKQINDATRAYDQGSSIRDLASEHGVSYGTMHRALSKIGGVQLRSRGGRRRRTPEPSQD